MGMKITWWDPIEVKDKRIWSFSQHWRKINLIPIMYKTKNEGFSVKFLPCSYLGENINRGTNST